eukprot:TRINITY_DN39047_c0_g1_i1.p1 TRINITY_DN39047_c0_g1~~TRINITY_DN39047_c0_g1_i1.p1  ORF type:complete len:223 (-),score=39.55 TRINITY_DN39047_c0_g1_i1:106-774(-)
MDHVVFHRSSYKDARFTDAAGDAAARSHSWSSSRYSDSGSTPYNCPSSSEGGGSRLRRREDGAHADDELPVRRQADQETSCVVIESVLNVVNQQEDPGDGICCHCLRNHEKAARPNKQRREQIKKQLTEIQKKPAGSAKRDMYVEFLRLGVYACKLLEASGENMQGLRVQGETEDPADLPREPGSLRPADASSGGYGSHSSSGAARRLPKLGKDAALYRMSL